MYHRQFSTDFRVFINRYLPGPLSPGYPTTPPGDFADRADNHLLYAIIGAGFAPGHHFVEGSSGVNPLPRAKSAIGTYSLLNINAGNHINALIMPSVELSVLVYSTYEEVDPFCEDDSRDNYLFSAGEHSIREEIVTYARDILTINSRLAHYMLILFDGSVRIARVDRTRVVTTKKITTMAPVCEFLWRLVHATPEERGQDTTVTVIEHDSALGQMMQARATSPQPDDVDDHARHLFELSLDPETTWLQVKVYEEHALQHRCYLVGKPVSGVKDLYRRGYVALDASDLRGPFVFLHDIWRAGFEQEGALLKTLNSHGVPYVPTLLYHGDVPDPMTTLDELQHYRLVVKEVGVPLEQFENGRQLVYALWCSLQAHEQAYEVGVMHRDIHPGNIFLHKTSGGEWIGLLNGWTGADVNTWTMVRNPVNKNTWMFASVRSLIDEKHAIDLPDVLESFFDVLLYLSVRFLPTNFDNPHEAAQFVHDYFEAPSQHSTGYRVSIAKKCARADGMISRTAYLPYMQESALRFLQPSNDNAAGAPYCLNPGGDGFYDKAHAVRHPVDAIMSTILAWMKMSSSRSVRDEGSQTRLRTHGPMLDLLRSRLLTAAWPEADKRTDVLLA